MPRLFFVHWHEGELIDRADRLRDLGYDVFASADDRNVNVRDVVEQDPDAIVIELSRLPSHGKALGELYRSSPKLRHRPLIFLEGKPEKVQTVRALLPDAVYTSWDEIKGALRDALASPPLDPLVPKSKSGAYSGTPLPQKLGIKADQTVALIGAPDDFEATLGDLPDGVKIIRQARGAPDISIWFVTVQRDLYRRFDKVAKLVDDRVLWVSWPKKTSDVESDLTENVIRDHGLELGLVDSKVCAVDETWSGLKFTQRRS